MPIEHLKAEDDFTEQNGATRVIPGSHRYDDKLQLTLSDREFGEIENAQAQMRAEG